MDKKDRSWRWKCSEHGTKDVGFATEYVARGAASSHVARATGRCSIVTWPVEQQRAKETPASDGTCSRMTATEAATVGVGVGISDDAWCHAACLSIAEGMPGWDEPSPTDSPAMEAVRKLRRSFVRVKQVLSDISVYLPWDVPNTPMPTMEQRAEYAEQRFTQALAREIDKDEEIDALRKERDMFRDALHGVNVMRHSCPPLLDSDAPVSWHCHTHNAAGHSSLVVMMQHVSRNDECNLSIRADGTHPAGTTGDYFKNPTREEAIEALRDIRTLIHAFATSVIAADSVSSIVTAVMAELTRILDRIRRVLP